MAARPAKRQRRSTRILSDDDDESLALPEPAVRTPKAHRQLSLEEGNGALSLSPTSNRTQSLQSTPRKESKASPKASPDKTRKSNRLKKEPDKTKSLHTFFGKVSEEQRWQRKKSNTPEVLLTGDDLDAIVDDDLSDDALLALDENASQGSVFDRRKGITGAPGANKIGPSGSRFLKPSVPSNQPSPRSQSPAKVETQAHAPWSDRYGPISLDELAVHKKKVTDVHQWFEAVISGRRRQKLLVLKGPAGTGKTATVSLIAKTLGLSPVCWQNPGSSDTASNGSVTFQFDDFLNRGGQFASLAFGNGAEPDTNAVSNRQVLVVEEFPTSIMRSADSFRSVIIRFLNRPFVAPAQPFSNATANSQGVYPVVMIISETLLSSSTSFSDSFTAHRLLGPEILAHPATTVIEFNPVAQTYIHKALDLVVKKEARNSMRRRVPGSAVIQRLAEMGDVRNAVNALEFLCVRTDINSDWSGTVAGKPKKSKDLARLTQMEKDSLKLVGQRETTLDMFHATGKVVYNKREDLREADPQAEPPPRLPDHLMHLYQPKASEVDIEALFNETGTDIQTFVSSLHENYALSCNGPTFVDSFDDCAAILSTSDILNPDSRRTLRSRTGNAVSYTILQAGSTDALRQDEISFHVATRGLIFSLPYPVSRAAPSSGRNSDKYKIFYPTSLRLWKPVEEVDALISLFRHDKSLSNEGTHVSVGGVASWKNTNFGTSQTSGYEADIDNIRHRKTTHSPADLVLDVLPYLARIKAARKEDTKSINRITQIQNAALILTGDEPDEDQPSDEVIVSATRVRTGTSGTVTKPATSTLAASLSFGKKVATLSRSDPYKSEDNTSSQLENLFLEDDDIVDDG